MIFHGSYPLIMCSKIKNVFVRINCRIVKLGDISFGDKVDKNKDLFLLSSEH